MNSHFFENPDLEQNRVELMSALQEFQSHYDVWGHGVISGEKADQIMMEGFKTDWAAVHDIAYKLPDNIDLSVEKITHWDYEARRFIVLIAVPKGLSFTDVGGSRVRSEAVKLSNKYVFARSEGKNIIVPAKIIGYVDANTYKFFANPNFTEQV